MTVLLYIGVVLVGIVLLTALFGITQNRVIILKRSIVIDAEPSTIFPFILLLKEQIKWNPWSLRDPNIQKTFSEKDGEIGSSYSWKGNKKVGEGSMSITSIVPNKSCSVDLNFGSRGIAMAELALESRGTSQTVVSWTLESDMGVNPLMRAFSPLMKKMVGKDYDEGLNNLKKIVEKA